MSRTPLFAKAATAAIAAVLAAGSALAQPAPPPPPTYSVPPPPGYEDGDRAYDNSPDSRADDDRLSYEAEHWAAENCVQQRADNTVAGAVIGGLFGAILGSGLAGHHERGAGAVVGGAAGAMAGAAIGGSAANNPSCPPGFVVRPGAPVFYYPPAYGAYVPPPYWYDPWIFYGNHWIYRPYPYRHSWYRAHPWHR